MKNLWMVSLILAVVLFQSCVKDSCKETRNYVRFDPVFVLKEEYRKPISVQASRILQRPGKLYVYKQYLFINEVREGIHVFDNTDPANPVPVSFISIPGNIDISIKGDVLYADAYTDLLSIDIRNLQSPIVMDRKEDVFTSFYFAQGNSILSHYEETPVTEKLDCSNDFWGAPFFWRGDGLFVFDNFASTESTAGTFGSQGPSGTGGSMARFTINENHLYAIGESELYALPLAANGIPGGVNRVGLPWGIETIFPYKNTLFVGANNGMHILSLDNPSSPSLLSTFAHADACDPVVVQNDIAYVTLRSGNLCRGFQDQLEVIDVSNLLSPRLLHTHAMLNPHGLSIRGNKLFICEGSHGLRTFDASNHANIRSNMRQHVRGFHAFDAIALTDDLLLVIGDDGFRQYNSEDISNLRLLSTIPVLRP